MSTQVTYETDQISLLCDPTMSSATNFCFFIFCNLKKKKIILEDVKIVKKYMYICEISFNIILICQKLGSVQPVQKKIKLPLPYRV